MPSPQSSVSFWAPPARANTAIAVGDVVIPDSSDRSGWVVATSENRGSRRAEGVAVSTTNGSGFGPFEIHQVGTIDADISGLAEAEEGSWVRCSDTGRIERCTPADGDDIIGYAEADGRVHLLFGVLTSTIIAGGGGATPGGSEGSLQKHGPDNTLEGVEGTLGQIAKWGEDGVEFSDDYTEAPDGAADNLIGSDGTGGLKLLQPSGLVAGSIPYFDGTKIAWLSPAGVPDGYVLGLVGGTLTWVEGGGGGGGAVDPATLDLSGYWKADYSGTAWAGTASAGDSSGRSLTAVVGTSTGTAVNGKTPALLDGVDDYFAENSLVCTSYMSASSYSIVLLVRASDAAAPAGGVYDNDQLFCAGSGAAPFGIAWSTSGVKAWHQTSSGATWVQTNWVPMSADAWHMVAVTFSGGTLSISVDGGTPETVAAGNVVDLGSTAFRVGRNYGGAKHVSMQLLEAMVSDTDLSLQIAGVKAYFNAEYGLSL